MDGVGSGNTAITADLIAAIDANTLTVLQDFAAASATVGTGGGPHSAETVAKALA